ncbi:hypothetical protein [Microbacterium sp. 13-71-7]|uniref:hypothetical protein n=1 Tax=Microbacterium sp. 13-71-7 TaxID=1970399 RepID=UPI000BD4F72A|nr:hypothetical protein [Microbacterium sp. 13-71-7]OZB85860.1 MAG: hypothetical protein B7X32_01900 [Microbacterium sp. 13-71-7]
MLRSWPALLAWGAGLIHLAIGASVTGAEGDPRTVVLLAPMLVIGVAELGWGVAVLRAGRIERGRGAALGAILAVILGAVALLGGAPIIAVAASSVLVVAAGAMAARSRGAGEGRADDGESSARMSRSRAVGTVLGAVLVAALVTPGLAQTDAGANGGGHDHGGTELPLVDPHAHH